MLHILHICVYVCVCVCVWHYISIYRFWGSFKFSRLCKKENVPSGKTKVTLARCSSSSFKLLERRQEQLAVTYNSNPRHWAGFPKGNPWKSLLTAPDLHQWRQGQVKREEKHMCLFQPVYSSTRAALWAAPKTQSSPTPRTCYFPV